MINWWLLAIGVALLLTAGLLLNNKTVKGWLIYIALALLGGITIVNSIKPDLNSLEPSLATKFMISIGVGGGALVVIGGFVKYLWTKRQTTKKIV